MAKPPGKQVRISEESLEAVNRARIRLNLPENCEAGVLNAILQSHADDYGRQGSVTKGDDDQPASPPAPSPKPSGHPFDNLMGAS